jgi:hypothetical protein
MVRVTGPMSLVAPGTVSAIDLTSGKSVAEIGVGRQPGAMALSPDRRHLVVANADDDTLSVIEVESRRVIESPSVRWRIDDPIGASPTALSGFRTVCVVASPYTKRSKVVSTHFNQPGLIRTIGLMLGFPPLNQILWHAIKGPEAPYPLWATVPVDQRGEDD